MSDSSHFQILTLTIAHTTWVRPFRKCQMQHAGPELPSQDFLHTITYRLALAHCCSLTERLADEVRGEMKSAEWNNATHEHWEALPWEPTHAAGASSVHSYILQDRLSLDIVTAWVQFLESWYSFAWWRELLWYGKTPHIRYCEHVCTYAPHFTPLSVPYQSHRIPWPDASNCSEHSGKKMVCGWEERLFTVTWFVISLEKTFLAFGSSLATYRQQHMLPAVFHSVFSTGTLPYTFNHLIPLWWIFFCLFNWFFVGLMCSFCFVSCSS